MEFVIVTKAELKRRFNEYNALYFNNQLPIPQHFVLWAYDTNSVSCVRTTWHRWRQRNETHFHINAQCFNWTDDNLRNVMIHEMIHIAIKDYMRPTRWWHWIIPPKQHDRAFVKFMNELNARYGLNVSVRAKQMRVYRKQTF